MSQKAYKPHYYHLRDKWTEKHKKLSQNLWEKHKESLDWIHKHTTNWVVGSMAGALMLSHPVTGAVISQNLTPEKLKLPPEERVVDNRAKLILKMQEMLPDQVQPLTHEQETVISEQLTEFMHINVKPELEGIRLNRSYGLIGAEQHLMRYPGDTMMAHFERVEDSERFYSSGMAPGRGAWGYFAPSIAELTDKDIQREKYYLAVQTFLSPGWNENVSRYYYFFKYRKMLIVNPENGKAMVVVIGDAGPAEFTGKHLGGSPEVMKYLERQDGGARGPVLYFFIDDPGDTIPLGPINY